MSQLPQGWELKTFGDVLSLVTNGVNGKQNKKGIGIPVSRIETIAEQKIDLKRIGYLESYDKEKIEKYRLNKNDILFSHINSALHLGKTAIVPINVTLYHGVNLLRLAVNELLAEPRYFNYYCKYFRLLGEFSAHAQHAVNQSSLNQKKLKAFNIPLAPLQDQKRIADKLDSVLAKVEAAQTRLDKIPTILKRFRQSVLAATTSGELTKDWREENEIDENWEVYKLKELSNSIRSGSGKKPSGVENGTPILRSSAVRILDIDYSDFRTIEESLLTDRDLIQDGDLLFTRLSGSKEYVGNCAKVGNLSRKMAYPDRLFKVELNDIELADYIEVYCSSPSYFKYIEESIKSSAGHQRITTEVIKGIEIKLPSKNERDEILRVINLLFAKASKVERQYLNAKSKIDSLTQSILSKAFSGKL